MSISSSLYARLENTLLQCGPFDNARALMAIFIDERIKIWMNLLPDAKNSLERVRSTIQVLHNRYRDGSGGPENALVLFLCVLSERIPVSDLCHRNLLGLAKEYQSTLMPEYIPTLDERGSVNSSKINLKFDTCELELTIKGSLNSLKFKQKCNLLLLSLAVSFGISADFLKVLTIQKGSIVLVIQLPTRVAKRIIKAYKRQHPIIKEQNIEKIAFRKAQQNIEGRSQFSKILPAIPFLGNIVAGAPIPVESFSGTEVIELDEIVRGIKESSNGIFALGIRGNIFRDALLADGDLVFLRRQERVHNGELAVVWVTPQGETTLKKIYYEDNRVRLQPVNPTMDPIYVPYEEVQIQAKVVLVIRQLFDAD